MHNIVIKKIISNYDDAIKMILRILPNEGFNENELYEWILSDKGFFYGAYNNNNLLGNIFFCIYRTKRTFVYIQTICVETKYNNLGIGKKLINKIIEDFNDYDIWAKISSNNLNCINLFTKLNFRQCSHKYTPYPLSKNYNTIYYPYIYQKISEFWNIYNDQCKLQDNINLIYN